MKKFTFSALQGKKSIAKAFIFFLLITQIHCIATAQPVVRAKLAILLLLNNKGGSENTADGVVAFYDDHFTTGIGNEDSYKFTNLDENLAINSNGTLLSIEGRPVIRASDTLVLQMWKFRQKTYLFKINGSNFSPGITAVMKDNYLKKETVIDLSSETQISFGLTADTASFTLNRFSVIYKSKVAPPVVKGKFSIISSTFTVFPNPVKGNVINLRMSNMKQGRYRVNLYSTSGQIIYSGFTEYEGVSATKSIVIDKAIQKGMYKLQLVFKGISMSKMVLFE